MLFAYTLTEGRSEFKRRSFMLGDFHGVTE